MEQINSNINETHFDSSPQVSGPLLYMKSNLVLQ